MRAHVETATGRFVWHDLATTDVDAARRFYGELLGWQIEVWKPGELDYPMIMTDGAGHGGFGAAQSGVPPHWLGHVAVEDVDAVASRAAAEGGRVLAGPMDIPDVGRFAVIRDPQGAVVSAFQGRGEARVPDGVFAWDELSTNDVEEARSFYGSVFGWGSHDVSMGDSGAYTLFRVGERDVAGCRPVQPGMEMPPSWTAYLHTGDLDATAARGRELGARVVVEPQDAMGVGRFAILVDPTGAAFALFTPSA